MQIKSLLGSAAAIAVAGMPISASAQAAMPARASMAVPTSDLAGRSGVGVPFVGIAVFLAIIVGIVIISDGDDDNDAVSP